MLASALLLGACGNNVHDKHSENKEGSSSNFENHKNQDKETYLKNLRHFAYSDAKSFLHFSKNLGDPDEIDTNKLEDQLDDLVDQLDDHLDEFDESENSYNPNNKEKKVEKHYYKINKSLKRQSKELSKKFRDYNKDEISEDKLYEYMNEYGDELDELQHTDVNKKDLKEILGNKVYNYTQKNYL